MHFFRIKWLSEGYFLWRRQYLKSMSWLTLFLVHILINTVLVRLTTMQVLIKKEMWSPGLWNSQLSFQCKRCDFSFISAGTVKLNESCHELPTAGGEFCKCFYLFCPCEKSSFRSKRVQLCSPAQTLQLYKMKLQRFSLLSAELFFKGSFWPRLLL